MVHVEFVTADGRRVSFESTGRKRRKRAPGAWAQAVSIVLKGKPVGERWTAEEKAAVRAEFERIRGY